MFSNSILTLSDSKNLFIRRNGDDTISDADVIDAVNDFYSIVQELERDHSIAKARVLSPATTITSAGLNLKTTFPSIGSNQAGFRVFLGTVSTINALDEVPIGSMSEGYYLLKESVFLQNISFPATVFFEYQEKTTRVSYADPLVGHVLEIDQDLERAWRYFLEESFYEGKYQFDLHNRSSSKYLAELIRYFDTINKTDTL